MNLKCTYVLRRFLALFLLGYISLGAIGAENSVSDDRKVWQDNYPDGENYLRNRRALVGHGCTVNRFGGDGITVGQVQTNLENLCDEDLTNNATVPCVASVSVGYSPLVSVKDMGNVYARGTEAGFVLGGSSKVLGLEVGSIYEIRFYKDGELVAPEGAGPEYTGEPVSTDMSTGVSLSLIQIGGEDMSREIHATAPGDFDEIQLVQVDGIGLDVASAVQVKYAFAGKARQFNVTQDEKNGMPAYSKYLGTNVKPWGKWNKGDWKDSDKQSGDFDAADPDFQGYKLINTNLDDGATIVASVILSFMGDASVKGEAYDGSIAVNPFKAGTQIGFVINQESLLDVGVGTTAVIELTDVNKKKKTYNISTDVLELSLGKKTGDATFSIRSDMDFSEAKFYFAGLGIGAGGASAKYAFINLEPEKGNHHCSINPSADLDICDCDNHYQLSHNPAIDVIWSVKESPADAGGFTLNPETGEVAGLTTAGRYVFTATAADGCTEDVVINYGIPTVKLEETPLINTKDENNYEVMTGGGFGIKLLEAEKLVWRLYRAGIDAVILQDLGLLKCDLPPLALHASTQCHIDTPEKAKMLEACGFETLVVARDLSLSEISSISGSVSAAIECFVHGALCVSYSGQCYLSHAVGGRSANRGECAQPCRMPYALLDADDREIMPRAHYLCLRDMNRLKRLSDMIDAGVSSFKIEGRLKDASYVKNITALYRKALDEEIAKRNLSRSSYGESYVQFKPDERKSFNRGYTEFYLDAPKAGAANFISPKSRGEEIGTVKQTFPGGFIFENAEKTFSNSDGLFFEVENNPLKSFGAQVRNAQANKVFVGRPQDCPKIPLGAKIFRNRDCAFEKEISLPCSRKVPVKLRFYEDGGKYVLSAKTADERGICAQVSTVCAGFDMIKRRVNITGVYCGFYIRSAPGRRLNTDRLTRYRLQKRTEG